jgi:DNA-directed RNA polymerase specialized sigma24 family protein
MPADNQRASELAGQILAYARERLGPHSEAFLIDPAVQAVVLSKIRSGALLEDAVLAEVHRGASSDRELANEFLAFFLLDLLRIGKTKLSTRLRRFLDTWDLAQSVLGNIWPELGSVRFESRASFISLLAHRLSWKAADHDRRLNRDRRREDLRVEADPEDFDVVSRDPSPASAAESANEQERLILVMLRLSERDQDLLRRHLAGEPIEATMAATGLSYEAARKALHRATRRARSLLASWDSSPRRSGAEKE